MAGWGTWSVENDFVPITELAKLPIYLYTKTVEGVESAVYREEFNLHTFYRLPDYCSVFQAELLAIRKASELAKEKALAFF